MFYLDIFTLFRFQSTLRLSDITQANFIKQELNFGAVSAKKSSVF